MSNVKTCAACSTAYAPDLDVCPHCGSSDLLTEGGVVVGRLPLFLSLSCDCGRGPWQFRLPVVLSGLVEVPRLFCASCGRRVQIPWPPVEDDMPKITVNGGATNARDAEPSPDADVSAPLVGAEADQGHPTSGEFTAVASDVLPEVDASSYSEDSVPLAVDYDSLTLAELRETATARGVPAYGTKSQITDRLREADAQ